MIESSFIFRNRLAPALASFVALFIALILGRVLSGGGVAAVGPPTLMGGIAVFGLLAGLAALRNAARLQSGLNLGLAAVLIAANGLIIRWAVHMLGVAIVFTP